MVGGRGRCSSSRSEAKNSPLINFLRRTKECLGFRGKGENWGGTRASLSLQNRVPPVRNGGETARVRVDDELGGKRERERDFI